MANGTNDDKIKQVLEEAKGIYAPQKEFQKSMYAQTVDPKNSQPDFLERGVGRFANTVASIATPPVSPLNPVPVKPFDAASAMGLRDAVPPSKIPIGIGGKAIPPQILGKPNPNGASDAEYRDRWKNPLSPEPVPGMNQGLFEPPYAGGVNPTANPAKTTPPLLGGPGGGGNGATATAAKAEEWPPSWATKNGWNISGKKGPNGIGMTPKGEMPTAVRISEKDRAGKGIAGAKLETDNSNTTLVPNPTYNKGIVDANGYSHVDDRKYIEVANQYKGEKVPLLEAVGIPKKGPDNIHEKTIQAIKDEAGNYDRVTGELKPGARRSIERLATAKGVADTAIETAKENAAATKQATNDYRQEALWERGDKSLQDIIGVLGKDSLTGDINPELAYYKMGRDNVPLHKNLSPESRELAQRAIKTQMQPILDDISAFEAQYKRKPTDAERLTITKAYEKRRGWSF